MTTPAEPAARPLDVVGHALLDGVGGTWRLEGHGASLALRAPTAASWRTLLRLRQGSGAWVQGADRALRHGDLPLRVVRGGRTLGTLGAERRGERRLPAVARWLDRLSGAAPFRVAWFGSGSGLDS